MSITLYTYDSVVTTTVSTAYFILNDGKGNGGYTVSANSSANTSGYVLARVNRFLLASVGQQLSQHERLPAE